MADQKDDKGHPLFVRTPNQASRGFGFDTDLRGGGLRQIAASPRPKFLFLVRFIRGAGQGSPAWMSGVTFAIKKVDRPTVTPQIQHLSQYNKKRMVQTGFKYEPVNIEFNDTVDQSLNTMWHEYSSYYFGEFRKADQSDWGYDVTTEQYLDANNRGFGFKLPEGVGSNSLESAHFFERLECYQLFGGSYLRWDLVHPKISRFDPDDLDYESTNQLHGIRMSLEYEAVIYQNSGNPIGLRESEEIYNVLSPFLNGQVYEPPPGPGEQSINTLNIPFFGNATRILTKIPGSYIDGVNEINRAVNTATQVLQIPAAVSGALGSFGKFDFGSGTGSNVLSNVMNSDLAKAGRSAFGTFTGEAAINKSTAPQSSIGASAYDVAKGKAQVSGYGSDAMIAAQMSSNPVGALNAARDTTSQVGFRSERNNPNEDPNGLW